MLGRGARCNFEAIKVKLKEYIQNPNVRTKILADEFNEQLAKACIFDPLFALSSLLKDDVTSLLVSKSNV